MYKKLMALILTLLITPLMLVGCGGGNDTQPEKIFSVTASCDENYVKLEISNKDTNLFAVGEQLQIVMLKPYEYYKGETDRGINEKNDRVDSGSVVGVYTVGTPKTIAVDRFDASQYDNLYNKFILAKNETLVAGPYLVNNIKSQRFFTQKTVAATKKGIISQGDERLLDLGVGWTEYNINPNSMVYPNEQVNEQGEIVAIDNSVHESNIIEFVSNGKTYYFKKNVIESMDNSLLFCKNNNIKALYIIWNIKNYNQLDAPYFMSYPSARDYTKSVIWSIDTSTELGAGYFTAVMEFMAERYSREDGQYGWVHRFVIGNEVDYSWQWNPILNYDKDTALSLNNYVEEYSRTMRIAEQATKKYYSDNMVLGSSTHSWTSGRNNGNGNYASVDIYNYLNEKTKKQGDYNWGFAGHPYPQDLSCSNFLEEEAGKRYINGDFNDTVSITWTNLEVFEEYVKQENMLYNGQMRRLYLTEGGVSSGAYTSPNVKRNELNQAAGIAYAYYKAMSMDCVDAFIYYKLIDSIGDGGGANFGLFNDDMTKKPSYEVFKYLDTQYSFVVANQYLSNIKYKLNGIVYSTGRGNISSYRDTMKIVDSDFNWEVQWSESKIISRQIEKVPELEDLLNKS